jgi:hypothetical protein
MTDAPDLTAIIARLLDTAEQQFGALFRDALRPVLADAFQQGVSAGFFMSRDASLRGQEATERAMRRLFDMAAQREAAPRERPQRRLRPKQRVASGTVRPLIERILADRPGLRVIDVQAAAAELDNDISPTSVGNELRRHKGTRYRQDGARWFLIADNETRPADAGSSAVEAGPWAERPDQAAA